MYLVKSKTQDSSLKIQVTKVHSNEPKLAVGGGSRKKDSRQQTKRKRRTRKEIERDAIIYNLGTNLDQIRRNVDYEI